jgi:hypothetical protein
VRRSAAALGLSAALLLGGGTSLVLSTLSDGSAGGADTGTTTTTSTTTTTEPASSSGSGTSSLGGYTVDALAEPFTAQYEQPNFPLPATPSLEFDVGYAATTDNLGSGSATASTFYPGQVVANAGPQLALLVPGVPLPPAPVWPLQAVTDYPQSPNTASLDEPGANMDATSGIDGSTATATLGDDAATAGSTSTTPTAASSSGNPLAASSSLIGIGAMSGTSSSTDSDTAATASASSTVGGISLLGGFINIGSITSTATANSDGTTGTVTGGTLISNASIAGEQVTIDGSGITAVGKNEPLSLPLAALNTLLGELGISMKVTNAVDSIQSPSATRTLDGLQISINLDTLDAAANKFASLLPAKLTSELPVALPDEQVITIDLATVTVDSDASPSFLDLDTGSSTAPGVASSGGGFTASTGSTDTGSGDFGSTGTGSVGTGSTDSTTSPPTASAPGTGSSPTTLASTPTVFRGIGSGLILLGLLAAAALAYLYKRADDASELLGTACAEGDPLGSRFSDDAGPAGEGGVFT